MLLAALPAHKQSCCAGSAKLGTRTKRLKDVFDVRKAHHQLYSPCMWLAHHLRLAWSFALLL